MKAKLNAACGESGRSFSAEVNQRLADSLSGGLQFGDVETFSLCLAIAAALSGVKGELGQPWHKSRLAHKEADIAIRHIMGRLEPQGEAAVPDQAPLIVSLREQGASEKFVAQAKAHLKASKIGMRAAHYILALADVGGELISMKNRVDSVKTFAPVIQGLLATAGNAGEAVSTFGEWSQNNPDIFVLKEKRDDQ